MLPLPPQDPLHWLAALAINGLLIGLAQRLPLLTPAGWVHAGVLGTLLWGSLGWRGWLAVVVYLAGLVVEMPVAVAMLVVLFPQTQELHIE